MSSEVPTKLDRARQADTSERYLAFLIGKEQYAIPLLQVKEVIEMSEPTPLPNTPPYFKGVINLRNHIISVLDLRSKLKHQNFDNGPKTAIIILDLDLDLSLGVIVDRINSVLAFHSEDVEEAPPSLSGENQYLKGIAKKDKKLTLILDVNAALSLQDLHFIRKSTNNQAA